MKFNITFSYVAGSKTIPDVQLDDVWYWIAENAEYLYDEYENETGKPAEDEDSFYNEEFLEWVDDRTIDLKCELVNSCDGDSTDFYGIDIECVDDDWEEEN